MDTEDMRSLAGLISQGAFRALKQLVFSLDIIIKDLAVIALTEALPTQTFSMWRMNDEGLTTTRPGKVH